MAGGVTEELVETPFGVDGKPAAAKLNFHLVPARDAGMGGVEVRVIQPIPQVGYDLCDQRGLIAWAEIPCITEHLTNARANALSQMEELVSL